MGRLPRVTADIHPHLPFPFTPPTGKGGQLAVDQLAMESTGTGGWEEDTELLLDEGECHLKHGLKGVLLGVFGLGGEGG